MATKKHLYVLGLGLIGASVARGLAADEYKISGWDEDEATRKKALQQEVVCELYKPSCLPAGVDGVLLAVPVPAMLPVVEEIVKSGSELPEYFTDVGSTKDWITKKISEILPADSEFVGAHPMAGSEKSGFDSADPLLFENAICVVTTENEEPAVAAVKEIWKKLGAHVMIMAPQQHDRVVARVSHLPHLTAAALVHAVTVIDGYEELALPLAAGGFRDTTRIAGGDPVLWRDIFKTNREKIIDSVTEFQNILNDVKSLLTSGDWDRVIEWLSRARDERKRIPEKAKGLLGSLFELRIQAPDRPGILAEITSVLSKNEINICDIEVLRVREGEMGTIRLAFRRFEECSRAKKLLQSEAEGIKAI